MSGRFAGRIKIDLWIAIDDLELSTGASWCTSVARCWRAQWGFGGRRPV